MCEVQGDVLLRNAEEHYSEALCRLNRKQLGYDYGFEPTRLRLARLLRNPGHKIVVALISGEVVGYIHANDHDLVYSEPMKNIMGIAVAEKAKRQGIDGHLLAEIEQWARETGAAGVRLVSGEGRTDAHRFYKACGYTCMKKQLNFAKFF